MRTTARTIAALALGLVVTACGQDAPTPSPSPSPTSTPPPTPVATPTSSVAEGPPADVDASNGWRRISVAERGFSLEVPDGWEELSPAIIGESGIMEQLLAANPDAAVALEQARAALSSGQIALFAFDTDVEGLAAGFATNLNMIDVGPVEGTVEQAAAEVTETVRQQIPLTGDVESDMVSLPAGDAALIRYEWEVDDGEGTTARVSVTQYAIIGASGNGYILSMSAASDDAGRHEETFRRIAESFREEPG
jgi:hypothetical protein